MAAAQDIAWVATAQGMVDRRRCEIYTSSLLDYHEVLHGGGAVSWWSTLPRLNEIVFSFSTHSKPIYDPLFKGAFAWANVFAESAVRVLLVPDEPQGVQVAKRWITNVVPGDGFLMLLWDTRRICVWKLMGSALRIDQAHNPAVQSERLPKLSKAMVQVLSSDPGAGGGEEEEEMICSQLVGFIVLLVFFILVFAVAWVALSLLLYTFISSHKLLAAHTYDEL
jgi:hypothetical protein